jgi:hypothetical protein
MFIESTAASKVEALRATSFSAGANNGPWIDTSNYEGDLVFAINTGALTGSVIYKIQDATDISGTSAADLSPAVASASVTTAGTTQALIVPKSKSRFAVRLVATVTTGPCVTAAILLSRPKTTA